VGAWKDGGFARVGPFGDDELKIPHEGSGG
jgi:hypothetical protein